MPKTPRGKRVVDDSTGRFTVAGTAPNGQAQPYFERAHGVSVTPWRPPDGKVGKPTGRTRALAEASRDRHIEAANDAHPQPSCRSARFARFAVSRLSLPAELS